MAKKGEVKKIRPSEAIRSLESYHEKVLMLTQACGLALQHNLIDKSVSQDVQSALNEVKAFYEVE